MDILGLILNHFAIGAIMLIALDEESKIPTRNGRLLFIAIWPIKIIIMAVKSVKITLNKDRG